MAKAAVRENGPLREAMCPSSIPAAATANTPIVSNHTFITHPCKFVCLTDQGAGSPMPDSVSIAESPSGGKRPGSAEVPPSQRNRNNVETRLRRGVLSALPEKKACCCPIFFRSRDIHNQVGNALGLSIGGDRCGRRGLMGGSRGG